MEINENMQSEHHKLNPDNNPMSLGAINRLDAQFCAKHTRLTVRPIAAPKAHQISS
jgi:hypothetical protein